MPINPSLALQVKPIELEDPISQFTKIAQARNLIGQGALRQQQMEHGALEIQHQQVANQEQQRGLAEADLQRQAITTAGGDLKKAREILGTTPGVSRDTLTKFDDEIDKHAMAIARQDDEKYKKFTNHLAAASEGLMAVDALGPDPAAQKPVYDARQQGMIDAGLLDRKEARPYAGPDQIKQDLAKVVSLKQVNERAAEMRAQLKAEHDQKMFPAEEQKIKADAGTAVATEGQKKLQNAVAMLSQAGSQEEYTKALGTIDAQTAARLPQQFDKKKLLALGQTPNEQVTSAQTAARDENTKANEAAIRENQRGRLAIAARADQRAAQIYEQTYGEGANPALIGVEPKQRLKAAGEAAKAADNYVKGQAASADMQALLDLAKSGNKLAYKMIPVEGVFEVTTPRGTVRINKQELDAYGGAGSFFDRIQGHVGNFLRGASIPPEVLKDIEAAHNKLATGVDETYNQKLNGVNQIFRSDFKPIASRAEAGLPDGGGKTLDEATAAKFYQAVGRDPGKARELAKKKGWAVQ